MWSIPLEYCSHQILYKTCFALPHGMFSTKPRSCLELPLDDFIHTTYGVARSQGLYMQPLVSLCACLSVAHFVLQEVGKLCTFQAFGGKALDGTPLLPNTAVVCHTFHAILLHNVSHPPWICSTCESSKLCQKVTIDILLQQTRRTLQMWRSDRLD